MAEIEFTQTNRACGKKIIGVDSSQYTPLYAKLDIILELMRLATHRIHGFAKQLQLIQAAFVFLAHQKRKSN